MNTGHRSNQTQLDQIYEGVSKFLSPLTTQQTYETVVREAIKLVGAEYGSVFLEEAGELKRVYASTLQLYQRKIRKRGFTYRAFKEQVPYMQSAKKIAKVHPEIKEEGIKATIFIPLSYKNKAIGVLSVDTLKSKTFTKNQLESLRLFGSFCTLAIRKAQLYEETKKAVETRDLFIAMAAHELRTPLTTINSYAQLLSRITKGQDNQQARWINELTSEVTRLIKLVNELLQVDSIRKGKLDYNFTRCNVRQVVEQAANRFLVTHPKSRVNLKLTTHRSTIRRGDRDKLLQVVLNLLDNAAKFSPFDRPIYIQLVRKLEYFIISIKNKGRGIARTELEKIFEGFYKGQGNYKEGIGLGLFIAKEIILAHGGQIKVTSRSNKGTTFKIILPI